MTDTSFKKNVEKASRDPRQASPTHHGQAPLCMSKRTSASVASAQFLATGPATQTQKNCVVSKTKCESGAYNSLEKIHWSLETGVCGLGPPRSHRPPWRKATSQTSRSTARPTKLLSGLLGAHWGGTRSCSWSELLQCCIEKQQERPPGQAP